MTNQEIQKQLQKELVEFNLKPYYEECSLYLRVYDHPRYNRIRISDHAPKPDSAGNRFQYDTLYIDSNNFIFSMEIKNIRFKEFNAPILQLLSDYENFTVKDKNNLTTKYIQCIHNKLLHMQYQGLHHPDTNIQRQLNNMDALYKIK